MSVGALRLGKSEWVGALRSHVGSGSVSRPGLGRGSLSAEGLGESDLIGSEFLRWHEEGLREICEWREACEDRLGFDPDPVVVFSTSQSGLVSAEGVLDSGMREYVVCLLDEDFRLWGESHFVDRFTFHIHYWSFFKKLEGELLERARIFYPEIPDSEFRLLSTGEHWGERCGGVSEHLCRWDGRSMVLLERAFSVSSL